MKTQFSKTEQIFSYPQPKNQKITIEPKKLAQELLNKTEVPLGGSTNRIDFGLPEDKLFYALSEIKRSGLMSVEKAKQLIYSGDLQGIKNGRNWRVSRIELIRYLNVNTKASL